MSAPVTAGDRAREVLAWVAAERGCHVRPYADSPPCRCCVGCLAAAHLAAEQVKALTEAGLLVEGVERVEWGVRYRNGGDVPCNTEDGARELVDITNGGTLLRRTRTTYPDRVTEWEQVE